jgi:hypothetical protein
MVEHRQDSADLFAAILEAMTALRQSALPTGGVAADAEREQRREAWMRQTMRAAQKEGYQRIAVVCGAWHVPALAVMPAVKEDTALLKGLPKRKVLTTWITWTYGRLALASGYGAGIESPGWYDFLWEYHLSITDRKKPANSQANLAYNPTAVLAARWLSKVAQLLRSEDLDAPSASVIEAVRLSETLASLRGRPLPGLAEFNEATQTVLCFGDPLPMRLIRDQLIVSERLGTIPATAPRTPLARNLAAEQKRLRLTPEATMRVLDLDLRKAQDLDRSRLLHRLRLLDISWGEIERGSSRSQGTFHERWCLEWQPELAVPVIEAGVWGNTVAAAAGARACHQATVAPDLPTITALLDAVLLADLPEAAEHIMARLRDQAAVAADLVQLMGALPPLAHILRYGNVRQTDAAMVRAVVEGLVARICIGLTGACGSLNDEAAETMFNEVLATHTALMLLATPAYTTPWHEALRRLADAPHLHGLISGRACRLLLDNQQFTVEACARRFGLALSTASAPAQAAAWVDGFLRHSGLLLINDERLWQIADEWVSQLSAEHFTAILPLLRRTFSTFELAERRQMGTRVAQGRSQHTLQAEAAFDNDRADQALPLIAELLGLHLKGAP